MQIVKPNSLGLSFRPIEYRKRFGLCISGYLHLPMDQGEAGRLWSEASMWNLITQEMAVPLIDEGVSKRTPEFLVHGHAYPTPDRADAVAVRVRLADREKTLLVFGDRYWDGRSTMGPAPFEKMPLGWDRAYGGPDFAENPVGRGRADVDGVRWLPNLELPGSRLSKPDQAIVPAGFGALDVLLPQRARHRGTYDQAWFKEHSPGFAPDLSWKHFNMAPQDQWLGAPLRGDESYLLENLHPARPLIEGQLPGFRVRTFVTRQPEPGSESAGTMREVAMDLTTVWFFPHAERIILVFHGLTECSEDDGSDITQILGAVEHIGEQHRKTDEHYLAALDRRSSGPDAALFSLCEVDFLPEGVDTTDPSMEAAAASLKPEGLKEDATFRRATIDVEVARDQARAQGKDPDALGIRMPAREQPPKPAEMPAYVERVQKELEQQRWATVEQLVGQLEKAFDALKQIKAKDLDPADLVHRGPPAFRAQQKLQELQTLHARSGKAWDRTRLEPKLRLAELASRYDYLRMAHMQPPARPMTEATSMERREELEFLLAGGYRNWTGMDLTGADLSNLDLRGVNLSDAWLESANLENSNLSRATLKGAVLAHANLAGTLLIRADLSNANLGSARIDRTVFDQATLDKAVLMRAQISGATFRGASMVSADLMETRWTRTDLAGADLSGVIFHKLDLKGCDFSGARFNASNFLECDLEGVSFRAANLATANFVTCKASRAAFAEGDLQGCVFVQRTELQEADFSGANLKGANLGDCNLSSARLVKAILDEANLSGANLGGADARLSKIKGALLRRTNLSNARLAGADLNGAILHNADLRGADLRDAHLFGADLSRVILDTNARLEGAVLERARIYPRRRPPAGAAA